MTTDRPDLRVGDICTYASQGDLVDRLIALKTWDYVVHTETYIGSDFSVASRNFIGINKYPVRWNNLYRVYRPVVPFDLDKAMYRFEREWRGQKYDLLGVCLGFEFAEWQANPFRQWCSEFTTNFAREGGCMIFQPETVADRVAPASLRYTSEKDLKIVFQSSSKKGLQP
jgi:hypothetical protein